MRMLLLSHYFGNVFKRSVEYYMLAYPALATGFLGKGELPVNLGTV
jgi:hypothetical protein